MANLQAAMVEILDILAISRAAVAARTPMSVLESGNVSTSLIIARREQEKQS
jgi:hypothetical protein